MAYCNTQENNCQLCSVKVLDSSGSGTVTGLIAGIEFVADNCPSNGKCVANMSVGAGLSPALNNAVNAAVAKGVVMTAAAGNDNASACNYSPGSADGAITVGSTTNTDARSSWSNFGSCVDVYASGSSITSSTIGSDSSTGIMSGTSMAAPRKYIFGAPFHACRTSSLIIPALLLMSYLVLYRRLWRCRDYPRCKSNGDVPH